MKMLLPFFILVIFMAPVSVGAIYYVPPYVPQSIPIMGYGTAGESVVLLQQTLKRLGYFPSHVPATGFYGMTTVQAVQGFQRVNNIVATGRVGPRTQAALANHIYTTPSTYLSCIPPDVGRDTYSEYGAQPISVREKLRALGAYCQDGVLYTQNYRPIYLYYPKGCWGNAPYNYREIVRNQSDEIASLKKRYTVIVIPCDRGGELY